VENLIRVSLDRAYANVSPETPSAVKSALKAQAAAAKVRLENAAITAPKEGLTKDLTDKKAELDSKRRQKESVERRMSELIDIEKPRQKFKMIMSAAFAFLVALVIVGFFIISWHDQSVRRAIFSGQSGIQFITLFSLVIAIILFGITGILQDKELAALLGGLSGYILGRGVSNRMRTTEDGDQESGFSLMELLIAVAIILIIAAIAIPNLLKSRIAGNESSVVGTGRTINTAQVSYTAAHPKQGFSCDLATLSDAGLVDKVLASGNKSGYVFAMDCKKQKGAVVAYMWFASPISPGQTGQRFFCGDQTGVIKYSIKDAADCLQNGMALQ
jgi:prepilin-type N-terminal cleavage/methylation domain-containing protein